MTTASQRKALEKRISGALRMTIAAHGPIGLEEIGSATKRLYGTLYAAEIEGDRHPEREHLDELVLDKTERVPVVIRVGDLVEVGPSRPSKRDGWNGTVIDLFIDKGGPVVEVHHPTDRIRRCVPASRIKGRRPTTQEDKN